MFDWRARSARRAGRVAAPRPAGKVLNSRRCFEDRRRAGRAVDAAGPSSRVVSARRGSGPPSRPGSQVWRGAAPTWPTRAAEQTERESVRPRYRSRRPPSRRRFERERAGPLDEQEEGERHRRVAERVHDERRLCGGDRARPLMVEADQQVGAQTDEPPADGSSSRLPPWTSSASRRRTSAMYAK